ncbi:hypothetical protein [Mucilaginibacter corticis]|uniref:hypothetical protein n=1 Tax=Mucilaginibacter corticis TaxID=2597670 RepID=UPI001C90732B|nr:hypothetical protein [Mucilaginibacter corticis]
MGQFVKELLSGDQSARLLTAAVISGSRHSDTIKVANALPNGQVLTLKRISLKDK